MAFLSFLKNSRSPEQKLKDAVKANNAADLEEELNKGTDPNLPLQKHGGNTALHFAASDGFTNIVEILIKAGANTNALNDFSDVPLVNACLNNNEDICLRLLCLTNGEFVSKPSIQRTILDYNKWSNISLEMKILMIKASPNVQVFCQHFHMLNLDCWQLLILCGKNTNDMDINRDICALMNLCKNKISADQQGEDDDDDMEGHDSEEVLQRELRFYHWIKAWKANPHTLQHYSRLSIRQSFDKKCNVFFGVQSLGLPESMKSFICMLS